MKTSFQLSACVVAMIMVVGLVSELPAAPQDAPRTVRELMWVWGNPEMAEPGPHTLDTFAQATSPQRARLLGTSNIVMAGTGLPDDQTKARQLTDRVKTFSRLVWETTPDGEGIGPPFVYKKRMTQIRELARQYPQLEGVLLDDMTTGKMNRGFKAEHVRHIRQELGPLHEQIKIWGVAYTMSLEREGVNELLEEVDVINLWQWHANRLPNLEKHVSHCEKRFPDKPIILGLYLYDYGNGRKIPLDLLELQCATALKLAHEGRIEGIVFLTIKNDRAAVSWTADWIAQVGDQVLGAPKPTTPPELYPRSIAGASGWIATGNGSILMSVTQDEPRIMRSSDEGRSWRELTTIAGKPDGDYYFSRLPDGDLLLTVNRGPDGRQVAWIRSADGGETWSDPTPVMIRPEHVHAWGGINVMADGRWAYCPYYEKIDVAGNHVAAHSLLLWSNDNGRTWSDPITFTEAADGNRGLTEMAVVQFEPNRYFAAIRADEVKDCWDGFYWSESADGLNWSLPASFGERGRMPRFYRLKNLWALAYRQYDADKGVQHAAIRFSRDGRRWSQPWIMETGVNAEPQLVDLEDRILAFNTLYPASNMVTRDVIVLPQADDWLNPAADDN